MSDNRSCEAYRLDVGAILDGEALDMERAEVESHLAECEACREFCADLVALRHGLLAATRYPLPDEVLASVFARTIDAAGPVRSRRWIRRIRIGVPAMAALIGLAVVVPRFLGGGPEKVPRIELERATAQTLFVLGLASDAVQRAESLAVYEVFDDRVSPALKRVSDEWQKLSAPTLRRLGA